MAKGDLAGEAAAVAELFAGLGRVRTKRMFGGLGIYRGEVMFAIWTDGTIFLKADALSRPDFEAEGSAPFSYRRKGDIAVVMSYWRLPDSALDDPEAATRWAARALEAAERSRAAKPKR